MGQNKANAKWAIIARDARARLAQKTVERLKAEVQLQQTQMAIELSRSPNPWGAR